MRSTITAVARIRTRLRHALVTIACLAAATSMGCGVYQAGIRTGPASAEALPQRDPAEVRLFGGEDPALTTEEVGFVIGVADTDEEWLALQRLRSAAAKLGADAVVDLRFEVVQSSQLVARGRAVRVAAPAAPTNPAVPAEPAVEPNAGGQP